MWTGQDEPQHVQAFVPAPTTIAAGGGAGLILTGMLPFNSNLDRLRRELSCMGMDW